MNDTPAPHPPLESVELLAELGSGASGIVYKARDKASGELLAVKRLAPELVHDAEFREAFRAEATILEELRSPHVAQLRWYRESTDDALLGMELVEGVSLSRLIASAPAQPEAALVVLRGSLQALAAAHKLGIVHRDYKPTNVIVEADGTSKLIDFGIAVRSTLTGVPEGTPTYAAPEQWEGGATPATDVYAATAVLVECLTGSPPYGAPTLPDLLEEHRGAPVPVHDIPAALRPLVERGMAKAPADRYLSAAEFLADLETRAGAEYGPDWMVRGAKVLAASAVALAAFFPGAIAAAAHGATVAGTAAAPAAGAATTGATAAHGGLAAGTGGHAAGASAAAGAHASATAAAGAGSTATTAMAAATGQAAGASTAAGAHAGATAAAAAGAGSTATTGAAAASGQAAATTGATTVAQGAAPAMSGGNFASGLNFTARLGRRAQVATACGAGIALMAAGAVGLHLGPFTRTAIATQLVQRVGTSIPEAPTGSRNAATVSADTWVPQPDGSAVQQVQLRGPSQVKLSFSYCDAQVCSNDENYDCIGNSYVPGFDGAVPLDMTIPPPTSGAQVEAMLVSAGGDAATMHPVAYLTAGSGPTIDSAALADPPRISGDGVGLSFQSPLRDSVTHHPHLNGRLCGYSEAGVKELVKQVGSSFANPAAAVDVEIHWSKGSPPASDPINFNGTKAPTATSVVHLAAPAAVALLLQSDPRWANTVSGTATLGVNGTVPTAMAMLFSAEGAATVPTDAAKAMQDAAVWTPAAGSDWASMLAYVQQVPKHPLTATETDVPGLTASLQQGGLGLVAFTDTASNVTHESLMVVSAYDPQHDMFTVFDPRIGALQLPWSELCAGNPWIAVVAKAKPA